MSASPARSPARAPRRVAVASGKGGTGKTLVSTSLAWLLAGRGERVTYVDTDVEAPNGHLFLHPVWEEERRHTVPVPALTTGRCSGCGTCQGVCQFHALLTLPDRVMVFSELCHGCGACVTACPERALHEETREVGTVRCGRSAHHRDALAVVDGVLDVGEAKAPPLIEAVLERAARRAGAAAASDDDADLLLLDAPPGTSCSAMTAVRDADLVLLVTEPTPFGMHDLELAVGMCRALGRPVEVIVNRAGLGNDADTRARLRALGIAPLAEIPYAPAVAGAYADGALAAERSSELREVLLRIIEALWGGGS